MLFPAALLHLLAFFFFKAAKYPLFIKSFLSIVFLHTFYTKVLCIQVIVEKKCKNHCEKVYKIYLKRKRINLFRLHLHFIIALPQRSTLSMECKQKCILRKYHAGEQVAWSRYRGHLYVHVPCTIRFAATVSNASRRAAVSACRRRRFITVPNPTSLALLIQLAFQSRQDEKTSGYRSSSK